jgi:hypothetical protein
MFRSPGTPCAILVGSTAHMSIFEMTSDTLTHIQPSQTWRIFFKMDFIQSSTSLLPSQEIDMLDVRWLAGVHRVVI